MFSIRTIAAAGALLTAAGTAHAQEIDMTPPAPAGADDTFHKGTLGFAFPITLLSNVAGSVGGTAERVPTVDVIYFLGDKEAVDLIAGVNFHRTQAVDAAMNTVDTNRFGLAVGAGYRMYRARNNLRSFLEPQIVVSWPDTSVGDSLTLGLGGAMGLERGLAPWLSVTGAVGAALNFTNSFKDIQLATTANLAVNLYWR